MQTVLSAMLRFEASASVLEIPVRLVSELGLEEWFGSTITQDEVRQSGVKLS